MTRVETSAILLRVAVGARLCLCVGVSICVATPNPEGFYCVGDGNN